MLDERWSSDAEEIGSALRRLLAAESTPHRVREAEASTDGRDKALEATLNDFGLQDLEASADIFARIAYELGFALATTTHVERMPLLAILGVSGVVLEFDGLYVASGHRVATLREDGLYVCSPASQAKRASSGDFLAHNEGSVTAERLGDIAAADRVGRFADMVSAARLVGAGQALLQLSAKYASEREQFGKKIGAYQGVAHRLADAATLLDAAELLLRKASFTAQLEAGGDGAPTAMFARLAWVKAVEAARFTATAGHQTLGGYGFAMEYDVQLYSRRIRNWALRGRRCSTDLVEVGRAVLNSAKRDRLRLLWQFDVGMPLPRWAKEADAPKSA